MRRTRFSTTTRLNFFLIATLAALAAFAALFFMNLSGHERARQVAAEEWETTARLQELRMAMERFVMPANDFLIAGSRREHMAWTARLDEEIHHDAARLATFFAGHPARIRRLEEFMIRYARIREMSGRIFETPGARGNPRAGEIMDAMDEEARLLSEDIGVFQRSITEAAKEKSRLSARQEDHLGLLLVAGGVLCLLAVFLLITEAKESLPRAIAAVEEIFTRFAAGDYSPAPETQSPDFQGLFREANRAAGELARREESAATVRAALEMMGDALFVASPSGEVKMVNAAAAALMGVPERELLGRPLQAIFHSDTDPGILDAVRSGELESREAALLGRDGSPVPVAVSGSTIRETGGRLSGLMLVVRDLSAVKNLMRKEIERKELLEAAIRDVHMTQTATFNIMEDLERRRKELEQAYRAKELLLREVYHRVKNNMQVISSLLSLREKSLSDTRLRAILSECRDQIRSMALIHERLYRSDDLTHIDFREYLKSLIAGLMRSYNISPERVRVISEIEDVPLKLDFAVPVGLLVNELVSNALKHAFPGKMTGEIRIFLHRSGDDDVILTVRDTGQGLPAGFSLEKTDSLGMTLIQALVREQLSGEIEFGGEEPPRGTAFRFLLRNVTYKERFER